MEEKQENDKRRGNDKEEIRSATEAPVCSRFTVRRSRRYLKHKFRLGDSSATQGYTYMHIVYYVYKYINKYIDTNIFNEKRTKLAFRF